MDGVNFIRIGKHNDDKFWGTKRYFQGVIDEIRIWSVARTGEQIASAMNHELTDDFSGLELYFRFNEGYRNRANDYSGFARNADVLNDPEWVLADWKY